MLLISSLCGPVIVALLCIAYLFVLAEEFLHLRKSKPVMIAGWTHMDRRGDRVSIQRAGRKWA